MGTKTDIPGDGDLILLTGATGYIGGRLLRALEAAGHRVRCLVRRPEALGSTVGPRTEVAVGDVLDADALAAAMRDVGVAYYLIHSMGGGGDFEERDLAAARAFGEAAARSGVQQIIYLGALGDPSDQLSTHLSSRQRVGDELRRSGVPVTELRASIVIGAGSLSFELVRALVDRLPAMVTPRWVDVPCQPIAIDDVIEYLCAVPGRPRGPSETFEVGGADRTTYGELMREYARQRGLRRLVIPVPVLTPWLSSLWLGLVTPLQARVGRRLVESLRNPTVVRDDSALHAFAIRPRGFRQAIAEAIGAEDNGRVAPRARVGDQT